MFDHFARATPAVSSKDFEASLLKSIAFKSRSRKVFMVAYKHSHHVLPVTQPALILTQMPENMEQAQQWPLPAVVPVMHRERFRELTGISTGVLEGWVNRGYIPIVALGKHKLNNMLELTQTSKFRFVPNAYDAIHDPVGSGRAGAVRRRAALAAQFGDDGGDQVQLDVFRIRRQVALGARWRLQLDRREGESREADRTGSA